MEPEEEFIEELPKYTEEELLLLQRFKASTLRRSYSCCSDSRQVH